jgi:muramidase (phage lysozyme)
MTPNVAALLATLRHSEATDRADNPYRVVYGFTHTILDLSDHPALTGEWTGVQTKYGHTSAAGAYQIERATWVACKTQLNLIDFTATSQDDAAVLLIKQKGGLALVNAGQFDAAIAACRGIWASLPGGTSGQPEVALASLKNFYADAGGSFA